MYVILQFLGFLQYVANMPDIGDDLLFYFNSRIYGEKL